jgi:hypothetical protein
LRILKKALEAALQAQNEAGFFLPDFNACLQNPSMQQEKDLLGQIKDTILEAANGSKVVAIRLAVGEEVSLSAAVLAAKLHKLFPHASIEIKKGSAADSVVVKDIEIE